MRKSGFAYDVVGVGALNVDMIAGATRMSEYTAERVAETTARFESGMEGPVDWSTFEAALSRLGNASISSSLGGSAWLAIYSLARLNLGMRLGYVGVIGNMPRPGISFTGQMNEYAIDHRWVARVTDAIAGTCLSYIDDTDRRLLIHPGANSRMHEHLTDHREQIAEYLAQSRFVHVTSFLDPLTPGPLLAVLRRAKDLNPATRVSLDPGHTWATEPPEALAGMLDVADLLVVNYREFRALGRYEYGETDGEVATRLLRSCRPGCTLVVTKRYDAVEVFGRGRDGLSSRTYSPAAFLRELDVEDATGAGDIFAAAVLAALSSDRLQADAGAVLGMASAAARLRRGGAERSMPDLSGGLRRWSDGPVAPSGGQDVVVMHDGRHDARAVRTFLHDACGLPATMLDVGRYGSAADADRRLSDVAHECGFAVCLVSPASYPNGGTSSEADQRLVHRIGFLQGRYGFGKVAVLAESGVNTFSNIAGIIRIEYRAGQVDSTFPELRRMLAREGMIGSGQD
ncbi:PfkB family carbohydrate kinase [Myceligenerans halotolerans]